MAVELCLMEPVEQPRVRPAAEPRPHPRRLRRRALGLCGAAATFSILLAAMLFSLQTDLIFPGAKRQGAPDTAVNPRPDEQLVALETAQGDRVVALFGPALKRDGQPDPAAATRPTLLYFYGNAMCLNDAVDQLEHFRRRLGVNVLVAEYAGYGMSQGKPSELGCQGTADAALAHLKTRKDVDPRKIVVAGWSLGGAVAIDLASRQKVAGLIALSTFTSMSEMSRRNFPVLPASLLLRHRFDSLSKIPRVTCPILIGHGGNDALIPHAMAERLADGARAPVMKFTVADAGHNDFFSVGGDQVLQAMQTFLRGLEPSE